MAKVPRIKAPESTGSLLWEGYRFVSKRCDRHHTNIFQTNILFQRFYCMRGKEAAELFYNEDYFERKNVTPKRIQKTLLGQRGVQSLDGEVHRARKAMFMSLMEPARIRQLVKLTAEIMRRYAAKWEKMESVVFFHEMEEILCRSVCNWAGVPLDEGEVKKRTEDLHAMIDGSGGIGARYWKGRIGRIRAEKWIGELIEENRAGSLLASKDSALQVIAHFEEVNGRKLSTQTAAVELINVLRPTVAVARFITFAAVALHEYPENVEKLRKDENFVEIFVQEVRRYYPFFPFVAARVKKSFQWKGYDFPQGQKVLLDLYGTDNDPGTWDSPEKFHPERFYGWNKSPFDFIPQGGGDHHLNHRCPGEWITIELMKEAVLFLSRDLEYSVPDQNLHISYRRIPAIPKSRLVLSNVKRRSSGVSPD